MFFYTAYGQVQPNHSWSDSLQSYLQLNIGQIQQLVFFCTALTGSTILSLARFCTVVLTRIPIPSRVHLIDTGNEGRARDSRHPPPIHQAIYFSLVGATSLCSVSQPRVARGDGPGGGWVAVRGGGVRGVSAPHIQ
jgi:hypothetical protein